MKIGVVYKKTCRRSKLRKIYNNNKTDENWNICTSLKRKAKTNLFIEKSKDRESFWKIFGPHISNKGHHSRDDYIVS